MARLSCVRISPSEQLELRVLPTVKVNFNPNNGLLKITGDNLDNKVEVDGDGTKGHAEVFVDDVSVGEFVNVISIKANLKGGDDFLFLAALQIDGNVTANFGDGADELDMDNLGFNMVDDELEIEGFLKANLGNDPGDFAEMDDAITIDGDVTIIGVADVDFNGDGVNRNVEADDITLLSDLSITFSGFGDTDADGFELDIDNVNVSGTTLIKGTNQEERLEITDCRFQGNFTANLDDGDDFINMNNGAADSNIFFSNAIFNGGDDNDTFLKGLDNFFTVPETILNFETVV